MNITMEEYREYIVNYNNSSDIIKLSKISELNDITERFIKFNQLFTDDKTISYVHELILSTHDSLSLLTFLNLYSIYLPNKSFYVTLTNDFKLLCKFIKEEIKIFVDNGLENQLNIKSIDYASSYEFNNQILNKIGPQFIKDRIDSLSYFLFLLSKNGLNDNPFEYLFSILSYKELAFVYAQSNAMYYENSSFKSIETNLNINELIIKNICKKNLLFIEQFLCIINKLEYSNTAYAISEIGKNLIPKLGYESTYKFILKTFDNVPSSLIQRDYPAYITSCLQGNINKNYYRRYY